MNTAAIILAAGYSSRMAAFKPLLPFDGKSAVRRCVELFSSCGTDDIIVVTGHRAEEIAEELAGLHCTTVCNTDFDSGMFSSICAGVKELTSIDGFFLLPVDIPLVRPVTIHRLIEEFDGSSVMFPFFEGERGHPPLIPGRYIQEILNYSGKGGMRRLLEQLDTRDIPVWDQFTLLDMDGPRQYEQLKLLFTRHTIGTRHEAHAVAHHFMPGHGIAHGMGVADVACRLGQVLAQHGCILNQDLLYNAGLLHDIAKGQDKHERCGARMISDIGFPGLAECIRNHKECAPPANGRLTEKELVCLADKLVRGCHRVPVRERFGKKLNLYADDRDAALAIKRRLDSTLRLQQLVERQCGRPLEEILQ